MTSKPNRRWLAIGFAGIAQPQSFMVLSIADRGTLELQLQFTKA